MPGIHHGILESSDEKEVDGTFGICCEPSSTCALKDFPMRLYSMAMVGCFEKQQIMNLDMLSDFSIDSGDQFLIGNRKLGILFLESIRRKGRLLVQCRLAGDSADQPVPLAEGMSAQMSESDSFDSAWRKTRKCKRESFWVTLKSGRENISIYEEWQADFSRGGRMGICNRYSGRERWRPGNGRGTETEHKKKFRRWFSVMSEEIIKENQRTPRYTGRLRRLWRIFNIPGELT